jgi:8-oxo-dGTP diphosphatase
MQNKKQIKVVAAIIKVHNQILCVQRPKHKKEYISQKFEFPGGKIEPKETRKEALRRELNEELSIDIEIGDFFCTITHEYPDFQLTMHCFMCKLDNKEQITLNEHIDAKWLPTTQLKSLDWIQADIPILEKLIRNSETNPF